MIKTPSQRFQDRERVPVGKHIPGVISLRDLVIRGHQPVLIECKLERIGREMHVPDGAEKVRDGNLPCKQN